MILQRVSRPTAKRSRCGWSISQGISRCHHQGSACWRRIKRLAYSGVREHRTRDVVGFAADDDARNTPRSTGVSSESQPRAAQRSVERQACRIDGRELRDAVAALARSGSGIRLAGASRGRQWIFSGDRSQGVLAGGRAERVSFMARPSPSTSAELRIMAILWTILIGFVIGLVAKFLMPGRRSGRFHHHDPARYRRLVPRRLSLAGRWAGITKGSPPDSSFPSSARSCC